MGRQLDGPQFMPLDFVTGARCVCAVWIVCDHFLPRDDAGIWLAAASRSFVAIDFSVVVSGFVTHWGHRRGPIVCTPLAAPGSSCLAAYGRFLARRAGRVVITAWLALFLGVLLSVRSETQDWWRLAKCFSFTADLVPGQPQTCPNPQVWVVASLLPCWLLYPALRIFVQAIDACVGLPGIVLLALVISTVWPGAMQAIRVQGMGAFPANFFVTALRWQASMLPDFALGVAAAALAQREVAPRDQDGGEETPHPRREATAVSSGIKRKLLGGVADLSMGAVLGLVVFLPFQTERSSTEVYLTHALSPLFALFLFAAASSGGAGGAAALLKHQALSQLGRYSLEVFLFQDVIFRTTQTLLGDSTAETFMACFLLVWLCSGVYNEHVQVPLSNWIRSISAEPAGTSYAAVAPSSDQASLESIEAPLFRNIGGI